MFAQIYQELLIKHKCDVTKAALPPNCQWYEVAFTPRMSLNAIGQQMDSGFQSEAFIEEIVREMEALTSGLGNGLYVNEVAECLGKGQSMPYNAKHVA